MFLLDQVQLLTSSESATFFVIGDWGGIPAFPFL